MRPAEPPQPGEWHPAYDKCRDLLRREFLHDRRCDQYFIQTPVALMLNSFDSFNETTPLIPVRHTLTKHPAYKPCPWTGTPFAYRYMTAADELGRCIASDWFELVPISPPMDRWNKRKANQ